MVDDDIDVSNLEELMWAALTRADPVKDIDFIRGAWNSPADPRIEPAERAKGNITSSRMIINACRPYSWRDEFVAPVKPSEEMVQKAKLPYAPHVMSWLSEALDKPSRLITQAEVDAWVKG